MQEFLTMRRLHDRGPGSRGLTVDRDGVMLGPGCVLVRRTPDGYRVANPVEVGAILRFALGEAGEVAGLTTRLGWIARALDQGQVAKAQILGLQLPFDTLGDRELWRLDVGTALVKEGYDPNQPRDERGRWTGDGAGGASNAEDSTAHALQAPIAPAPPPPAAVAAVEAGATRSLWGAISRLAPELLVGVARTLAGPLTLAGAVLTPTNDSNIHGGQVPGVPGVSYRSDEGVLTIIRQGPDGTGQPVYTGFPDADGFYHDDQGNVVGRKVGTALLLNTGALSDLASAPSSSPTPQRDQDPDNQNLLPGSAPVNEDDQPRICPNPSPEGINGRSERSLAYQEQITGLPRGFDVAMNGVRFDGCDERTGNMLEAKGPGIAWPLFAMPQKWLRSDWAGYFDIMNQAYSQNQRSGGRTVEWHFAEKAAADFFSEEFKRAGYSNIVVKNTPANVLKAMYLQIHDFYKASSGEFYGRRTFQYPDTMRGVI